VRDDEGAARAPSIRYVEAGFSVEPDEVLVPLGLAEPPVEEPVEPVLP
jgi:hypothetical protein